LNGGGWGKDKVVLYYLKEGVVVRELRGGEGLELIKGWGESELWGMGDGVESEKMWNKRNDLI
jgi:hypothetical protein